MAEDRMLSDEILLGLINKNSGGGTTNYNNLDNLPQIGGVTLQGNKTASDLGLATETALADKADKSVVKNEFLGTLDEWNALTIEQRKAYDTYQIKGDYAEGRYIYLPTIYSEEERQVGVWTDGKPLYQKTVKITGFLSAAGSFEVDTGLTSSIIEVKDADGSYIFNNGDTKRFDSIIINSDGDMDMNYGISVTMVKGSTNWKARIAQNQNRSNVTEGNLTLQYTKTTDQPGSGTWTPDGQLAHHYSTSEKIVGTWIDGSTVYERTWDFGSEVSFPSGAWISLGITIPNISKFVGQVVAMDMEGTIWSVTVTSYSGLRLYHNIGNSIGIKYLTLQYTKTA